LTFNSTKISLGKGKGKFIHVDPKEFEDFVESN